MPFYIGIHGLLKPKLYDFNNWEHYKKEVQYFADRSPDAKRGDVMALFSSYMSDQVLNHLSCLVFINPHDHEIKWSRAWLNEWLGDLTEALYDCDKTIVGPRRPTVDGWLENFKEKAIGLQELWTGLDALASSGAITYAHQIERFWHANTEEVQQLLLKKSPYFDPDNKLWKVKNDPMYPEHWSINALDHYKESDTALRQLRLIMVTDPPCLRR